MTDDEARKLCEMYAAGQHSSAYNAIRDVEIIARWVLDRLTSSTAAVGRTPGTVEVCVNAFAPVPRRSCINPNPETCPREPCPVREAIRPTLSRTPEGK